MFRERTEILLGKENIEKLKKAKVAIFGIGGVGGYAAEALIRAGIGNIAVIDGDNVARSNLNRQILATEDVIGKAKTEVLKERAISINPEINIETYNIFYSPDNADEFDLSSYDYIIDAIDTVPLKTELIVRAKNAGVKIISSMGAGFRLDPSRFKVADVYDTTVCPLAKIMRKNLRDRNIEELKCVYSDEMPHRPEVREGVPVEGSGQVKKPIGSLVTSVAVCGMMLANEVIKDIISIAG